MIVTVQKPLTKILDMLQTFESARALAKEQRGKAGVLEENIEVFGEFVKELRKTTGAAGCHIMAVGFEWIVSKIVERAGLKKIFDWRSMLEGEITRIKSSAQEILIKGH